MADPGYPFLSAVELGRLYRTGGVSPVEVTEAILERIETRQAETSAYITVTRDRALADARAAENALMSGNDLGPMLGIPVALKDLCETAGVRTTSGSSIRAECLPTRTCTVARRLARAGSVLLGKTNMVEFAFGPFGLNPHYDTPPNPWDAERVPGGSSSGSGVAVASGLATAAIGTDTGGSVRIPAAYCGITGLKTTVGRVSRAGITPLSFTLDSVGPMTREVEDAALMYSAIVGRDPEDPTTLMQPVDDDVSSLKLGATGLRVGVVRSPFFDGADPEVVSLVEQALDVLTDLGVRLCEMGFPEAQRAAEEADNLHLIRAEAFTYHRGTLTDTAQDYDPRIRKRLEPGAEVTAADYIQILQRREEAMARARRTLEDVEAVVGPTMPTPAPRTADLDRGEPARLHTRLVNWLGLCAISIPCGFTRDGLPVGLQFIGRPFCEGTVLRLAHAYEDATSWHSSRPPGC
ncbi:MAG: amidase [Candidatus Latescibacteria bacterium]|nr:amidase [Candidatus Latescibacterota bacterium]